ncbi:MAG: hypothetical protein KBC48_01050 [Candidatus Pacebacteria bacterium]|nr:hypothetical protein [Candidatus Paceibacterota bacterium]
MTNLPDPQYVYHGSHELFEEVVPHRQRRLNKQGEVIFDQVSFHATPYKWIAISYMSNRKGRKTGVDLYNHHPVVAIFDRGSLEDSLKSMYSGGGYLYTFDKNDFHHTEGLGNLEVITTSSPKPVKVERIDDPVAELKKLGVEFDFIDLNKEENAKYR